MLRYVIKRILLIIPIMIASTILVFTLMYFCPGDPATMILGNEADPAAITALREKMGLNDPYIVRLGKTLWNYAHLDLGNSYMSGKAVAGELAMRIPNSLRLSLIGIVIGLAIGLPVGILSAVHHDTPMDYVGMFIALLGISMPGFWLALMMISLFAVKLQWLPPFGVGGLKYWILPVLSTMFGGFAGFARQSRSSMLDVLYSDYIVMARSKGLPEREVILKHALPNALIPIVTMVGGSLGGAIGGGMITETVFSIPGVGFYLTDAIANRDYIVIQSCVIVMGVVFTLMMVVTDIVLAAVDPRIKAQFASKSRRAPKERKAAANG